MRKAWLLAIPVILAAAFWISSREKLLVDVELRVPAKLADKIRSGEGSLYVLVYDARDKTGRPMYVAVPHQRPLFPFRVRISETEFRRQLREQRREPGPPVLKVYYCQSVSPCGPRDAYAFVRVRLPPPGARPISFQGFNPGNVDCADGPGILAEGKIRLDPAARAHFPGDRFLLAMVAQPTDGTQRNTRYQRIYSREIDLSKNDGFRVPRSQTNLRGLTTGHFLFYLLDEKGCGSEIPDACAERLIRNRDEDMSHVLPLTEESLVAPICGNRALHLLAYYEPDWDTITIPAELLR